MNVLACLIHLSLLVATHYVYGLTTSEISKFRNGVVINTADPTNYRLTATGLPDHDTEKVNPNTASDQNYNHQIPKQGVIAAKRTCLPMGIIGFAINGVAFFNPYTAQGYDAVKGEYKEIFDRYDIHREQSVCIIQIGR